MVFVAAKLTLDCLFKFNCVRLYRFFFIFIDKGGYEFKAVKKRLFFFSKMKFLENQCN